MVVDWDPVVPKSCEAASVSERPFPLDTTKDKLYNPGAASSGNCPRAGSMLLESRGQDRQLVNTTCNSWRCLGCRDRNLRRFKAMVVHGVSTLDPCMFITITYKAGSKRLGLAGSVARDWRALWRLMFRLYPETRQWGLMRVMELTKQGTPHFHVIAGSISGRIRCYGNTLPITPWLNVFEKCECWSHRMSRLWEKVQGGESYIVHTIPVVSAAGAGAYMAKYLAKEFSQARATVLGMTRRFSANKGWPREQRVRIKAPGSDGWRRTSWAAREVDYSDWEGVVEFDRVMTDRQRARQSRRAAKQLLASLGRSI